MAAFDAAYTLESALCGVYLLAGEDQNNTMTYLNHNNDVSNIGIILNQAKPHKITDYLHKKIEF